MARNRRNRSGNRRERPIDIPEPANAGIIKRSAGQLFSSKQYRQHIIRREFFFKIFCFLFSSNGFYVIFVSM